MMIVWILLGIIAGIAIAYVIVFAVLSITKDEAACADCMKTNCEECEHF